MEKTSPDQTGVLRETVDLTTSLGRLGDYRILRRLGEGGMGSVYLCQHEKTALQVAIKVLNNQLASGQGYVDRFYREARSGVLLNHPNIVRTLQYGRDGATSKYYLVMELIDGPSVQALLDQHHRLSVPDAVHIILSIARALEYAHSRNIIHRDIKPDNILLTLSGIPKLADLGLARRTDEASHLTAARQGFGTTHYMPYEQAINAKYADGRSDIYALGATLYQMLAGSVPFPGDNHLEVIEKKNQGVFTPAGDVNPAVPPVLDTILARMLARQPADRYQTVSELIVDLDRSSLAAPLPSFADPERAAHDPMLQAHLASSSTEPTRLDPDRSDARKVQTTNNLWLLRVRLQDGQVRRLRATTEQLLERLRQGRLPASAEARRLSRREDFHPLEYYPELKEAAVQNRRQRRPRPVLPVKQVPVRRKWDRRVWVGISVAVGIVCGGLVALLLCL